MDNIANSVGYDRFDDEDPDSENFTSYEVLPKSQAMTEPVLQSETLAGYTVQYGSIVASKGLLAEKRDMR
jgi:hypothetical protein